jgi:hypothetical protein
VSIRTTTHEHLSSPRRKKQKKQISLTKGGKHAGRNIAATGRMEKFGEEARRHHNDSG